MEKRIYLSPPDISGNEIEYVLDAFRTNWIAPLGPNVEKFEKMVAEITGVKNAVALSSGTAAMHLALMYLGVGRGDIVFCSSLTFAASVNPVKYLGAEPVFIDSEPESWNMSHEALEHAFKHFKSIGQLPKAVITVDLYGQSADMDRILEICDYYDVPLIEDAAEALGAYYKEKSSGSFGKFGVLSFNGNKIVTTSGGGMLVSNDEAAIEKCRFWATQSREKVRHYEHKEIGYNYRLSNVLAGIGVGQLEQIDEKIRKRKEIYLRYKEAFNNISQIKMMNIPQWSKPNYWFSVITLDDKSPVGPDMVIDSLEAGNIESRPVWKPMHLQPVFNDCMFFSHLTEGSVSENLFLRGVCLPSGSGMEICGQERVIRIIKDLFRDIT